MKTATVFRLGAIVLIALGLVVFVYQIRRQSTELPSDPKPIAPPPPVVKPPDPAFKMHPWTFTSNNDCKACHAEIFAEWQSDEHSRAWFNKPLFPQDPKRTECVACHASVPILENGLDKEIRVRADRFEEGIGCIECHKFNDTVLGPLPGAEAPCNPRFDKRFKSSDTCMPCHAPHGTFDEWKASAFKDKTCQDCHMPLVDKPDGGKRRSHRFLSARQEEMRFNSVTPTATIEDGKVIVRITNDKVGHSFPGEISNRVVELHTKIFDEQGLPAASHKDTMQAPPRPQRKDKPTTQILAGETRVYEHDLPENWSKVEVSLIYKLLSFWPHGLPIWDHTLTREE